MLSLLLALSVPFDSAGMAGLASLDLGPSGASARDRQESPPPKTLEDHLQKLEARVGALDRRAKALTEENARLEAKLTEAKTAKEAYALKTAQAWVKRYGPAGGFSGKQSAEIEDLWKVWVAKDQEEIPLYLDFNWRKREEERWKPREEAIRAKLTPAQAEKVVAKVREEQEQLARSSLGSFHEAAKVEFERRDLFNRTVLSRLKYPDGAILLQARPAERVDWHKVLAAVEESLPDLQKVLTEAETASLRATVAKWKPQRRPW